MATPIPRAHQHLLLTSDDWDCIWLLALRMLESGGPQDSLESALEQARQARMLWKRARHLHETTLQDQVEMLEARAKIGIGV